MSSSTASGGTKLRILKGASEVVDVQEVTNHSVANGLSNMHLSGVVDLDGEVVKVHLAKISETISTISAVTDRRAPKLEVLEISG